MHAINNEELEKLPSRRTRTFQAIDDVRASSDLPEYAHDKVTDYLRSETGFFDSDYCSSPIPEAVTLKVGARVMLVATMQDIGPGLVNGAAGVVTDLPRRASWVEVEFDGMGREKIPLHRFTSSFPTLGTCSREQIPLMLAWAMTHHKAQGKTISKACVNPRAFSPGQVYVALSRTKSFDDLCLLEKCRPDDVDMCSASDLFMEHHDHPDLFLEHHNNTLRGILGTWKNMSLPRVFTELSEQENINSVFEE